MEEVEEKRYHEWKKLMFRMFRWKLENSSLKRYSLFFLFFFWLLNSVRSGDIGKSRYGRIGNFREVVLKEDADNNRMVTSGIESRRRNLTMSVGIGR